MRRLIVGTAGHIDHGKTALVRALTGIDTDRLPEEKRRGITIELGFASLSLPAVELGIVDVPGHEALVRTMLAGATGIDVVLLVIAADEGVMPQTREHLAIMELLEVPTAVVALTKCDAVDDEWLELVTAEVTDLLADTRFHAASVVPVSAVTGAGLDSLRDALGAACERVRDRRRTDLLRLPVDRAFTARGTGTVVTGTLWSGEVSRDASLTIWTAGTPARARGLQVHGSQRAVAEAGERVALALAVDRAQVNRGDTITGDDMWEPSMLLTTWLRVLSDAPRALRQRQRIRFHLGTAEVLGRVALLEQDEIAPGGSGWVQLRLESPCIARAGDRFVIRAYSPVRTIGGGTVIEPAPAKRKRLRAGAVRQLATMRDGDPAEALHVLVCAAGVEGVPVARLPIVIPYDRVTVERALIDMPMLRIGDHVFDPALADRAATAVLNAVDAHHAAAPLDHGLPREALRSVGAGPRVTAHTVLRLIEDGTLRSADGALARSAFQRSLAGGSVSEAARLLDAIQAAGLEAPGTRDLGDPADLLPILRFLAADGSIAALPQDRWLSADALAQLLVGLDAQFVVGQTLATADLKDAIGVSRKFLIPILEHLDQKGMTQRAGDHRIWIGVQRGPAGPSSGVPAPAV